MKKNVRGNVVSLAELRKGSRADTGFSFKSRFFIFLSISIIYSKALQVDFVNICYIITYLHKVFCGFDKVVRVKLHFTLGLVSEKAGVLQKQVEEKNKRTNEKGRNDDVVWTDGVV